MKCRRTSHLRKKKEKQKISKNFEKYDLKIAFIIDQYNVQQCITIEEVTLCLAILAVER